MNRISIKANLLFRIAYELLSIITPIITAPYVARVLGADGVGVYSYLSSIASFFMMFSVLGTVGYGTREIARIRDDKSITSKTFWEIELLTVYTTVICSIAWVILSLCYREYTIYCIVLIPSLLSCVFDISWLYTGLEQVKYTVIVNMIFRVLSVVAILCFVKSKNDLVLYFCINSFSVLFGNISSWIFLPKLIIRIPIESLEIKKHFRKTIVYFIPTIAISIYTVLDKALLGLLIIDKAVSGYYEQADKLIRIIKAATYSAVNGVLGARQSYLFEKKDNIKMKMYIESSLNMLLFVEFGCVFGLIGISDLFVPFFFGDGYEPVITLLCFMTPLLVIIAISNTLGAQYLTPSGQIKKATVYLSIGSAINLITNILLIPTYKAIGAVIASIIAEIVICLLFIHSSKSVIDVRTILLLCYKRLIAGSVMLIILRHIENTGIVFLDIMIKILGGGSTFVILLLLMKDDALNQLIVYIRKKLKSYDI